MMNERIRLFAKDFLFHEQFTSYGESIKEDRYEFFPDELQAFVEFIVAECVSVVEDGKFLHDQAPTALFAKECSSAIKQHVGVEE